jgi:hypothetical protein
MRGSHRRQTNNGDCLRAAVFTIRFPHTRFGKARLAGKLGSSMSSRTHAHAHRGPVFGNNGALKQKYYLPKNDPMEWITPTSDKTSKHSRGLHRILTSWCILCSSRCDIWMGFLVLKPHNRLKHGVLGISLLSRFKKKINSNIMSTSCIILVPLLPHRRVHYVCPMHGHIPK